MHPKAKTELSLYRNWIYLYRHDARTAYVGYSWADFEVHRPASATGCTDGRDGAIFGVVESTKFHRYWCRAGCGTPKTEILRNFGAYSLRNFYEIFIICGECHDRLTIQIWGFAHQIPALWGFFTPGGTFSPNFSAPLPAELYVGREHVFEVQKWGGPHLRHTEFGGAGTARAAGEQ